MENLTLLRQINQEVQDYQNKQVQIVPGLTFNQWEVLQRVYHYYGSKFSNSGGTPLDPIDDDGDRMYFYNIVKNPCKVFTKAVDFDTKNIRLLTVEGQDPLKTWFMERDLKFWMRDKQFGKVLNRLFRELPIYGTVVIKVVNGYPYFVDLRNFIVEQSADSLEDMNYKTEIHLLTVNNFKKVAKEMGWEQSRVDKTIELFNQMKGVSHIKLFERYGAVPTEQGDGSFSYPYKRVFYADVGADVYNQQKEMEIEHAGVELDSRDWDPEEDPYWEFHTEKLPGRWLGLGVVESLFEPQIRQNQLANLQSKASAWLSMHVFQTRDMGFNRNLAIDVKNGEVLNSESEVSEVVITDRNLAHFSEEFNKWMKNRDEMTFSYDVVQGERLPAGTPLGSAQISQAQTLSYFQQIQEDVALDVKEMLYEVILPQFQKENTAEHTLRLVGKDLDEFISLCKNRIVAQEVTRMAIESTTGKPFPTEDDIKTVDSAVSEAIKQGKEHLLTIDKNFYKDLKYDVDIDITGESVDTRVRSATLFAALQAITADPTITTDPVKRRFLFKMLEDGGVSPNDFLDVLDTPDEQSPVQQTGSGGGVSAPQLQYRIMGKTTATV